MYARTDVSHKPSRVRIREGNAHLRPKGMVFLGTKVSAEGDSEASKSPRPKARFSQMGHGCGKRNHSLRGIGG